MPGAVVEEISYGDIGKPFCFQVQNGTESLLMQASDEAGRAEWVAALRRAAACRPIRSGPLSYRDAEGTVRRLSGPPMCSRPTFAPAAVAPPLVRARAGLALLVLG